MKTTGIYTIITLCGLLVACSSVRRLHPLGKGESAVTVSLGGPVTQVGNAWLPLPLLSAGYARGITRRIGIEAGFNGTAALYGLAHVDAGVNWYPFEPHGARPGLTVTPKVFLISNFTAGGFRWYPTLTPTLYWDIGRHCLYAGAENWFEPHTVRSDGNPQRHHWLAAPYLGYGISKNRWQFQLEGRLYTPNLDNTGRATKNIGINDHGIISVFIGASRSFGGSR